MKIKVKSLVYSGRPVIAVFISDYTKQVQDVISMSKEKDLIHSKSTSLNEAPNDLIDKMSTHI